MERVLQAQLGWGGKEVRGSISFRSQNADVFSSRKHAKDLFSSVLIHALTTESPRQDAVSVRHGSKEKKQGMCLLKSYKSALTAGK